MAERQSHGLINENRIKELYSLEDYLGKKDYTAKYDAQTAEGTPVSIKTTKHGCAVDMGDYFRNANADKDFYLIVSFWKNDKLNIHEEFHMLIPHEEWQKLFKREFDERIRKMLDDVSHERWYDRIWREQRLSLRADWGEGIVKLRPKRDHKSQKRMQCAISYKDILGLNALYATDSIKNSVIINV